jgi:hypothetical protein
VNVITAAKLKWQPHTREVLTEGAFTFMTGFDLLADELAKNAKSAQNLEFCTLKPLFVPLFSSGWNGLDPGLERRD